MINNFKYLTFIFFTLWILSISLIIPLTPDNKILLFQWRLDIFNPLNINFPLMVDKYRLIFSSSISFISANVLLFSKRYIKEEKEKENFIILIILFILSINLLIFVPHIIFLLVGWDGLGLVSFLLVIHYPTPRSLRAGYITVLTNRVGDVIIIISIPIIYSSLNLRPSVFYYNPGIGLISLLLIGAALTKRAQIPFSSWLPAAIAAPTPISALVHSSTLVTAGVFLIFRFYPLLSLNVLFRPVLLLLATLTRLMAGLCALKEWDIKKIIALSTLSQLGVIIFRLAINIPELAFFHIISHATFKALLFISAGDIILQTSHTQDLRQFGNYYNKNHIPITSAIISNLRLIGFPFIAGFFSKDLIIEIVLFNKINLFIFLSLLVSTAITLFYSSRIIFLLFYSSNSRKSLNNNSSSDKNINLSLTFITAYTILRGAMILWYLLFPYIHPSLLLINKVLIISILTLAIILIIFKTYVSLINNPNYNKYEFTYSIWFINTFNSQFILFIIKKTPIFLFKSFDRGWNEILVGENFRFYTKLPSNYFIKWQNFLIRLNFLVILILLILGFYF